jgi:hypothetical protein
MNSKSQLKAVPTTDKQPSAPFATDAEREGLAIVNVTDSGAPVLDVDAVLRRTAVDYVKDGKR